MKVAVVFAVLLIALFASGFACRNGGGGALELPPWLDEAAGRWIKPRDLTRGELRPDVPSDGVVRFSSRGERAWTVTRSETRVRGLTLRWQGGAPVDVRFEPRSSSEVTTYGQLERDSHELVLSVFEKGGKLYLMPVGESDGTSVLFDLARGD